MAQDFLSCDRDQEFWLAPSVREWLPAGHLAWWLIEVVGELDLAAFYAAYRADGSGRPAHDPGMMVGLSVFAYCVGERSSRRIERRCVEDVAFRVMAANRAPDQGPQSTSDRPNGVMSSPPGPPRSRPVPVRMSLPPRPSMRSSPS